MRRSAVKGSELTPNKSLEALCFMGVQINILIQKHVCVFVCSAARTCWISDGTGQTTVC